MKCISESNAQYLCINRNCQIPNPYICADPSDQCKVNHQSCSLISLSYLLKKIKIEPNASSNTETPSNKDILYPLYQKSKSIASTISLALASQKIIKQINNLLETTRPLEPQDKDKIAKFMNDRKIDNSAQDSLMFRIEKQLQDYQLLMINFSQYMKVFRDKQIQDLRKKLLSQKKLPSQIIIQEKASRIVDQKTYKKQKDIKRKKNSQIIKQQSPIKHHKTAVELPSPIHNPQNKKSLLKNQGKDKQKQTHKKRGNSKQHDHEVQSYEVIQDKNPIVIGPSALKSRIPQIGKSGIKNKGSKAQEKISSTLKNHQPKQPLFSRITNDMKTIRSFFSQKIVKTQLLFRASQNQFMTNVFHEKCDGHSNTLTLVLTQFDKVIGGFTSLPWSNGNGEWYEDEDQVSFLFSLTLGERYPLVSKQRAIWCSKNYGPSFGNPDLQISQKANKNSNSCANFPMSYNNGNYKNTPGSIQLFCGTKSGHFKIKEWEVYQLTFS